MIVVASSDNESSQVTLPGLSICVPVPVIRGLKRFLTMSEVAEVEDGVVIIDCVAIFYEEGESSYIMSYSRSPSSLLRYLAAQPCFAASYLKFTRLAGIAHYITTINTNHQSDSEK